MLRIAILDDYQDVALSMADWSLLPKDAKVDRFGDNVKDETKLAERLQPYEVLIIMRERTLFSRSLIERLPNLKLLITSAGRNAAIDQAACKDRGITVCGTDAFGSPTAELAWGLLLALFKNITVEDRATREGKWSLGLTQTLEGRTLGVLGLGKLGQRLAEVGKAFRMDVIAWSQNLTDERCAEVGVRRVEKDALFREADAISIHLVLSDRSRGLVGARELGLMKPTAYLVNTSRGPIVDEAALVDALKNRRIGGAGLDVFDVEPLPADHPLRSMPNTVITPHLGYGTEENYRLYFGQAVENIVNWLAGKPVKEIAAPRQP
ncbi:MAG: D-2-hydroxyacid dehydrogenase family protein [Acetobacterales bacterium]